jgi:hypothetical protein
MLQAAGVTFAYASVTLRGCWVLTCGGTGGHKFVRSFVLTRVRV